jgi:AraC family transcriptional regulator, regulatory protein of adaptative response / methylated-DNA-[protein]-cysteine methyltransferase
MLVGMETTFDTAEDQTRYRAIRRRDPLADGRFFYSVKTTGVYCRPSCGARLPRPENVAYHRSADDAERAGFRPCKRCQPRGPAVGERGVALVQAARARLEASIEASEPLPTLGDLAAAAKLSSFHFHRLFKQQAGMTPRQYAAAVRLQRFGQAVRDGASVTGAIYEAGYSSSSRFYEQGPGALGMSPTQLRRGGEGLEVNVTVRPCKLGQVLIAATARGVCAVFFGDRPEPLRRDLLRRFPQARIHEDGSTLRPLADRIVELVDTGAAAADIPLDLVGTAFQQKVWKALREIPPGKTTTYRALARRIGAPKAIRAVGTACGANPVSVAVPCHRVLRSDGGLGGYAWGIERKRALLARERAASRARAK